MSEIVKYLTKKLQHGKDFLIGDKMTIADFAVASIVFNVTQNEIFAGGKAWSDKARALIGQPEYQLFEAWHKRMEE